MARYITNALMWQQCRHISYHSCGCQVNGFMSHFTFGGLHGFQPLRFHTESFCTEPLCIEQARVWIAREPFVSLVTGEPEWPQLMQELLGVAVPLCVVPEDAKPITIRTEPMDVVLRLGYFDPTSFDVTPRPTVEEVRRYPERVKWYLHFLKGEAGRGF